VGLTVELLLIEGGKWVTQRNYLLSHWASQFTAKIKSEKCPLTDSKVYLNRLPITEAANPLTPFSAS